MLCISNAIKIASFLYNIGGEYPEGNELQLDFEVLSTSSFSVLWDTPNGGVDIVNLEYICFDKKDSDNLNTEVGVLTFFSTYFHY